MRFNYLIPLILAAGPALADPPPCLEEDRQLQEALTRHPPMDPRVMHDVLSLRHQGLQECHGKGAAKGRAKLQEALARATPPGLERTPPGAARRPEGPR